MQADLLVVGLAVRVVGQSCCCCCRCFYHCYYLNYLGEATSRMAQADQFIISATCCRILVIDILVVITCLVIHGGRQRRSILAQRLMPTRISRTYQLSINTSVIISNISVIIVRSYSLFLAVTVIIFGDPLRPSSTSTSMASFIDSKK